MSDANRTIGRPSIQLDRETVRQLAAMFLTVSEIAAVVKCSRATLERNYAGDIREGREEGAASLKRTMFMKAMKGDNEMLKWLSKNFMGMSDKMDSTLERSALVNVAAIEAMTPEERKARVLELIGKLKLLPSFADFTQTQSN